MKSDLLIGTDRLSTRDRLNIGFVGNNGLGQASLADALFFSSKGRLESSLIYSGIGDKSRPQEQGKMYFSNGTTKYINYGDQAHLNIDATSDWSICFDLAWTNTAITYLLSKVNSSSIQGWGVLLNEASLAGRLSFRIVNTTLTTKGLAVYTNSAYNDGTVRRFVITKSAGLSASTVAIYVNNVAVTTVSYWDTLDASPTNVSNFNIFGRSEGSVINSTSKVHGIMIYNKVLNSDELTKDYNGEIANINSLVFADTCECADPANSYDSSSYKLVGAKNTWTSSNHVNSNSIRTSFENRYGYKNSSGIYLPIDATDFNKSIDGTSLTYKGQVAYRAKFKQQKVFKGNGTTYYGKTSANINVWLHATKTTVVEFILNSFTSSGLVQKLIETRNTGSEVGITIQGNASTTNLVYLVQSSTGNYKGYTFNNCLVSANYGKVFRFETVNLGLVFTIDGVVQTPDSTATTGSPAVLGSVISNLVYVYCHFNLTEFSSACISDLKIISDEEDEWHCPMQETSGNLCYDVGPLEANMTIYNYASGAWVASDYCSFYNQNYGYGLSSGIMYPLMFDGTSCAGGVPLTNKPDGYKFCDGCDIDFTGGIATPDTASLPTAYSFADAWSYGSRKQNSTQEYNFEVL